MVDVKELLLHDAILLDEDISPLTAEAYLTRTQSELMRRRVVKPEIARESSSEMPSLQWRPDQAVAYRDYTKSRHFPELAYLYHSTDFPRSVKLIESNFEEVNNQLDKWKEYLRRNQGMAPIRIEYPTADRFIAKRTVLLPTRMYKKHGSDSPAFVLGLIRKCLQKFSPVHLDRYRDDQQMASLFCLKMVGTEAKKSDLDLVPLWKMEVMLMKMRTDRALQEWIKNYEHL